MKRSYMIAALAACLIGGAAQATTTLNVTSKTSAYSGLNVTIKDNGHNTTASASPIVYHGSLDGGVPTDFFAYCVDLAEVAGTGTFNVVNAASVFTVAQYNSIATLISNNLGANSAAWTSQVQAGIWEILNETSSQDNVSTGNFKVDFSQNSNETAANALLNAGGIINPNLNLFVAQSNSVTTQVPDGFEYVKQGKNWVKVPKFKTVITPGKQDFLYWTVSTPAVPEPATWAMMILGMGAVGVSMRRRATKVSFA